MKRMLLILSLLIAANLTVNAQGQYRRLQSIFIYNFTKQIKWPEESKKANFVIGVLGNSPLEAELRDMGRRKRIDQRPIRIEQYEAVSDIGTPNILFIPESKTSALPAVNRELNGAHTLTISEKAGAAQKGCIINFVLDNNRLKFELNTSLAKKHGLEITSYLKSLAILVE